MGGKIKVVKKEGAGTLMRMYLIFGLPLENLGKLSQHIPIPKEQSMVMLALNGSMGRSTMSKWLNTNGVRAYEASNWEGMMQVLHNILNSDKLCHVMGNVQFGNKTLNDGSIHLNDKSVLPDASVRQSLEISNLFVIVDAQLLDLSTNIWKIQLSDLSKYQNKIKVAWLLNHHISSTVKLKLRRMGYSVMVNLPFYKSKLVKTLMTMIGQCEFQQQQSALKLEFNKWDGLSSEISTNMPDTPSDSKVFEVVNHKSVVEAEQKFIKDPGLCQFTQSIPNSIYPERTSMHDSITTMVTHPRKALNALAMTSEISEQSEKKSILHPESTCANMHVTRDAKLDPVNVSSDCKMYYKEVDGNLYTESDFQVCNEDSLYHIETQSDFQFRRSICKQYNAQISSEQMMSNVDKSCMGELPKIEMACRTEAKQDAVGKLLNSSSTHLLKIEDSIEIEQEGAKFMDQTLSSPSSRRKNTKTDFRGYSGSFPVQSLQMASSCGISEQKSLKGIRILLAEDTPVLQRVATIILEKMGATVVVVGDGLQAVDALNCMCEVGDPKLHESSNSLEIGVPAGSTRFDLILMDCQMPKLDGYEATKAIRRAEKGTNSRIPIVALTAHAMPSDEDKCLEVGMDAYLTKPIDYKLMVSTILSLTQKDS